MVAYQAYILVSGKSPIGIGLKSVYTTPNLIQPGVDNCSRKIAFEVIFFRLVGNKPEKIGNISDFYVVWAFL